MNKKGLYKALSVILVVAMLLPMLPARVIKAEEETVFNPDGETSVATPSAITLMAVGDNTTLNLLDGIITVTNQTYVQKTAGGTVVSQGDITGELILTGNQANSWNVTLSGANIPAIRFKNISTNGYLTGTASGDLNITVDGTCNFTNGILYNLSNIRNIYITGMDGNVVKNKPSIDGSANTENIVIENVNFNISDVVSGARVQTYQNVNIVDCTSTGGPLQVNNANTGTAHNYMTTVKDCEFQNFGLTAYTNVLIDNVTVTDGNSTQSSYSISNANSAADTFIIKNSNINVCQLVGGGSTVKILNSKIECKKYPFDFDKVGTVYIEGSTLITDASFTTYDLHTLSNDSVCLVDNSIIFQGNPISTKRFFNFSSVKARFDPLDNMGNRLFLNKVRVPGASTSMVTVSINGRDEVNLGTDSNGYLYLYLPTGEHTVFVTDVNGLNYTKTFTSIGTRESSTTSNNVGDLDPAKAFTNIATPYVNAAIQYSFDNTNWNNATTDAAGYFKAVIPDNANHIYIKLISTGEVKHAIITDGEVGHFYDDKPIITEQSNPALTYNKGATGTLYVTAVPFANGSTLNYQWYKDGEILTGKTSPVLNLTAAKPSDAGTYTCVITESDGRTVTSISIIVTIDESQPEEEGELKIISQSSAKTLIKGYSTELYVNAKPSLSTRELTYQWYKDEAALPGATDTKLVLNNAKLEDSGLYLCRVQEGGDYIDSVPIPVTVINNPLEGDVTDLNALVDALTGQIETLTGQLNAANQEKKTLQNTINTLEGQIITYTNQIAGLQQRIEELEQELEESQGENTTLKQTILNLNNQIISLNQQILDLQADLDTANNEKAALELIVTDLNNDINNLNQQITLLEQRLADSEAQNEVLINQVAALHNTISGLEAEIADLRSDIDALTEQNQQLLTQVETLVSQKTALENEVQRLLRLLDDAYETIDDLTEQVNNLTNAVNTLTEQLNTANEEKTALQGTITGLEGQIANLNNQIDFLNNRVSELEAALQQEGADKETLYQTIIDLNNQITNLNQTISSLQTQLITVTEERNALQTTVNNLSNQLTILNGQITILEGKLADSEEENTSLKNQVTILQNTISGLQAEITDLQNEINTLKDQNTQLLTQIGSLNGEKTALENEIQRLLGLLDDAYNTIDRLTEQVNTLTEQLNTANEEKTALQGTITGLEGQITNLNNQITVLNNRVSELEAALQQEGADKEALNQIILDLNNQITNLSQTVNSLQTQLTAVTEERDTLQNTVNHLNNQVSELNQQITILIGRLEDSEAENTTLKNQLINLQNTITGLENDITNLQNEITIINNNYNTLQGQLNTANDTISSLNALLFLIRGELGVIGNDEIIPAIQLLKAQLQQEKNKNILLQDQLDGLNDELDTAREYNSVLIQKLQELMLLIGAEDTEGIKNKIIELQTALAESQTRIQELEQEKIILIERLREAEELNQTLQNKIEELLDLADADVEELKRKILELTEQVNQMVQKNQELQESIQTLTSQVTLLNTEKSVLESEIVRLETLLKTANSTIEELRQQIADMAAGKTIMENENTAFRNEISDLKQQLADMTNVKTDLEKENAALKLEIERLKKLLESKNHSSGGNSGGSDQSSEVKDLQDKLEQTKKELEEVKKELEKLKESQSTDPNHSGTEIKVPENAVVVLPAETVDKPVIKAPEKTVKEETIVAEKGWEIAPTLESEWAKEIDLVEAVGQANKSEKVDYTFYAREEEKPAQIYTQTVEVKKPVAIPNFTMDKLIYLGSEFLLNVANIPKDAKISYKSANNGIAKIDKNGKITPVKAGKTVITGAVTKDGIPYQFTVNVTVQETDNRTLNLKEQAVQTSTDNPVLLVYKLVNKDKTTKINLNGYSNSASISYISADSSIATVSKDGIIKGIKKGTTTVTATLAQNDTIYTYIIKVRVDDGTADTTMWDYLTAA